MDNRKISICLTSYNRFESTLQAFSNVVDDERVSEIVIVDDCSEEKYFNQLKMAADANHKIKLFRNTRNKGCYLNKRQAVLETKNDFIILFDSDNVLGKDYLDKVYEQEWSEEVILAPDFAMPFFSYQAFGELLIGRHNVGKYIAEPMFSTALNTCNMFVNRKKYLEVFDDSIDPVTCDSIYFNYCWIKAGYKIKIVKGLQYLHSVHSNSHYKLNVHLTPKNLLSDIESSLKQLK